MSKYPELSDFSLAFADAYRGFMKEYRITGQALTAKLGRALGYVSERINGKRALDTEDVDALALLAGDGWTGRKLMIELARRAKKSIDENELLEDSDVGGQGKDAAVTQLDGYRENRGLTIEYDPANEDLVRESLADRHAALRGEDPQPEQEAPDTP
ncbi:hypothetical protein [Leucobacter sp. GX24907]